MKQVYTMVAALALAASLSAQGTKAPAALQGTWVVASINGQPAPDGSSEMSLTFAGDKYHQTVNGEVNERGTFAVDASKKPMTIDLTITEGADAGTVQLGILEITGDSMRLALDMPGAKQRPGDFTVKEGAIVVAATKKKG
jgi:uncharacterized protein (TIGR03067 family)